MKSNLPVLPSEGDRVSDIAIAKIERSVANALSKITRIDVLEEWRAKAAALEAYLRGKGLQRPILGAQRRVEARIGQLLGEPQHGGDRRSDQVSHDGLEKYERADFRILGRALSGECALTEDEWRKSRRALVMLLRERLGLIPETPDLPQGTFRCIVADPPWVLDTGPDVFGGTGESGHDDLPYSQMTVDSICNLKVEEIAAPDSHLYLWTTNRYIEASYFVARAWGFKPSVLLVWAKAPHGIGLGDAYRLTTEFILYARRGSLKEMKIIDRTWFDWPRGRHSVKPKAFYEMVESMTPAPGGASDRMEMFARTKRNGWTVWGHEA